MVRLEDLCVELLALEFPLIDKGVFEQIVQHSQWGMNEGFC